MKAIYLFFCSALLLSNSAAAVTAYNLGGVPTQVQVQVAKLHNDAELIGMSQTKIEEFVNAELKKAKIRVGDDGKLPAIVIKVTTLDVGPRLSSYVTVDFKELARLVRLTHADHPRFVTSWNKSKMIASEPTKHEAMVMKTIGNLLEEFLREAHE